MSRLGKLVSFSKLDTFKILFVILILSTLYLRFSGLGFSHFYGDETKTFYLDKTVPAYEFFLSQRKGPGQFLVVWLMEKIFGNYDELIFRIPFAIAGTLSVFVFFILIYKFYLNENRWASLFATFLFSFSGFFIAFSRTIQYQSFVILLGLVAIYLWKIKKPVLSGVVFGISLLFHYDSVFFLIPVFYEILIHFKNNEKFENLKKTLLKFLLPIILICTVFYVPYLLQGNFLSDTLIYLSKRQSGFEYLPSSSLLTFFVYNPNLIFFITLLLGFYPLLKLTKVNKILQELYVWFFIPFITFELIFSNPGTHIYNYFLPLIILVGFFISQLKHNLYTKTLFVLITLSVSYTSFTVFVPNLNSGYPWNTYIFKDKYQLFLYGFPYNRNWGEVREFINQQREKENFFTNDNIVVSSYYLYPLPTYNYNPKYYILVDQNQEYKPYREEIFRVFEYEIVKTIPVDENLNVNIYKRGERKPQVTENKN